MVDVCHGSNKVISLGEGDCEVVGGLWEEDLSMLSWSLRRISPPVYIVISAPPLADAVTTLAERRPSSPLALGKLLQLTPSVF